MKRFSILLFISIGLLFMSGCTAKSIEEQTPTEAAIEATATIVAEVPIDMETDTCVDCHTDKELLIDTAAPVEEEAHEAESEGVG